MGVLVYIWMGGRRGDSRTFTLLVLVLFLLSRLDRLHPCFYPVKNTPNSHLTTVWVVVGGGDATRGYALLDHDHEILAGGRISGIVSALRSVPRGSVECCDTECGSWGKEYEWVELHERVGKNL